MKPRTRDALVLGGGLLLLALYLVQATCDWRWSPLASLQETAGYKLASGLALAAYLRMQWTVGSRRRVDPARALFRHRLGGALAPLVLYLHATRVGYGYLVLLVAIYVGTAIVGLAYQPVLATRWRWLFTTWFIAHLVLATTLIALVGYHAVIALAYQ